MNKADLETAAKSGNVGILFGFPFDKTILQSDWLRHSGNDVT